MARPSTPPSEPIGYGRQYVDQDDIDAVVEVLRSNHLTQGPAVAAFEAGLCKVTGAPHAVAVANGTAALHLAYHALGVGPGHSVLTSANTFLATASAAQFCGGEVEFVDIELRTGNLDLDVLEARLASGRPPHVVTAVHFAGLPCDMERLIFLKRRHDFRLVEDAAHALGASYRVEGKWYRVGEHPEVDATILSFHPVKTITTGEGGAVLTSDPELAARLTRLRSHGIDRNAKELAFGRPGPMPAWFGPMVELGFNYRMCDLQAALGLSQLRKLPDFLAARREVAMRYVAELREFELLDPGGPSREHAWHLFVVRTDAEDRDALFQALHQRGIHVQLHYYPVPLQPWFRERGGPLRYPRAESHGRRSISLPIYPSLSDGDQRRVLEALRAFQPARQVA